MAAAIVALLQGLYLVLLLPMEIAGTAAVNQVLDVDASGSYNTAPLIQKVWGSLQLEAKVVAYIYEVSEMRCSSKPVTWNVCHTAWISNDILIIC